VLQSTDQCESTALRSACVIRIRCQHRATATDEEWHPLDNVSPQQALTHQKRDEMEMMEWWFLVETDA
jgi:hypothetical protein